MRGIRYKDFRPITRALSVKKKVSENTVLCIKHNFQLKLFLFYPFRCVIKHNTIQIQEILHRTLH